MKKQIISLIFVFIVFCVILLGFAAFTTLTLMADSVPLFVAIALPPTLFVGIYIITKGMEKAIEEIKKLSQREEEKELKTV